MTAVILNFPPMVKQLDNPSNRVREWRLKRGMTQIALAEAMGLKQNTLSRIENGDRAVSLHRLRQIAAKLGVDVGRLLPHEDNRMGLDDEGVALLRTLEQRPDLAPALNHVAQTVSGFNAEPPAAAKDQDKRNTVKPIAEPPA